METVSSKEVAERFKSVRTAGGRTIEAVSSQFQAGIKHPIIYLYGPIPHSQVTEWRAQVGVQLWIDR